MGRSAAGRWRNITPRIDVFTRNRVGVEVGHAHPRLGPGLGIGSVPAAIQKLKPARSARGG
jgi:hypothetical protein